MRLSEAMMLGSSLIKFNPYLFLACGKGCLLGAALAASTDKTFGVTEDIVEQWPWLRHEFVSPNDYYGNKGRLSLGLHIINSLAFQIGCGELTLEQAVAWVRSVEPQPKDEETFPLVTEEVKELVG